MKIWMFGVFMASSNIDWQSTEWGMSIERVKTLLPAVTDIPSSETKYDRGNLDARLFIEYESDPFLAKTEFLFDSSGLAQVSSMVKDKKLCAPFRDSLRGVHGEEDSRELSKALDISYWDRGGMSISYTRLLMDFDGNTCAVNYKQRRGDVVTTRQPAALGPFGLRKGMSLADVGGAPKLVQPGKYILSAVPKPHSSFEAYAAKFGPKSGLCWIKAIAPAVADNSYGTALKASFSELRGKLASIYGMPQDMDSSLPGSIWTEPGDWMMATYKRERMLASTWDGDREQFKSAHLSSVAIGVIGLSVELGRIEVDYSFDNSEICEEEISNREDAAL